MGRVDHLLLCRSSTRACFGLGLPGSRQAIHLLIVVFVRGLRKTIAPGSRAARGAVALGGMRGKQHFECAQI